MANNAPIGVFDSGVGGLTVAREIMRQMPEERIVYFGDTARVPYGSKSKDTIIGFSRQIAKFPDHIATQTEGTLQSAAERSEVHGGAEPRHTHPGWFFPYNQTFLSKSGYMFSCSSAPLYMESISCL